MCCFHCFCFLVLALSLSLRVLTAQALQLEASRKENLQLREAHQDVTDKLDTAIAQLREKTDSEDALSQQVMQLEARLNRALTEKDHTMSRSRLNERAHSEELGRITKEYDVQQSRLATAEDGLQRLRTERQELSVQVESLQYQVRRWRS